MERKWYSRKYNWSPMPHAIFFHKGYAIHGTLYVSRLGRPCLARLRASASDATLQRCSRWCEAKE